MPSSHDTLVTCKKCSGKSPVRDMKYDLDGKSLICGRCYEIRVATSKRSKAAGQYADPQKISLDFGDPLEGQKEVKYFCPKCKYRFKRKKERGIPKICPYCSKGELIVEGSTSADELLRQSTGKEYDY